MKIILTDFVPNLGDPGDEVTVAAGYARNYLVPKKLAFEATPANIKTYENNLKQRARKIAKMITEAEAQKQQLESVGVLEFTRKSGEEGKLFGSVTSGDIEEALSAKGFEIDKKKITLSGAIKSVGEYEVSVKILRDVAATIKLVVKAEAVVEEIVEDEAAETNEAVEVAAEEGYLAEDSNLAAEDEAPEETQAEE